MNIKCRYENGTRMAAAGAVALVMAWCASASAQVSVTFSVDENCNGRGTNNSGTSLPLLCQEIAGEGISYDLFSPPGLTDGALALRESANSVAVSDLIVFTGTSTLIFYSDASDGVDAPADVAPFPAIPPGLILPLLELGPEGNNGLTYTPTAGQPGFVAGLRGGTVTYDIHSDGVPEPATLALLGIGLAGLGFSRRKRS